MENIVISNTQDLQVEIARLKAVGSEQKDALAARFKGPAAIFGTVKSLFPKSGGNGPDLLRNVSRFAIPFALNRTIFRNANFIVKGLVGLASRKAAGFITEKSMEGAFLKGKNLMGNLFGKTNKANAQTSINLKANE